MSRPTPRARLRVELLETRWNPADTVPGTLSGAVSLGAIGPTAVTRSETVDRPTDVDMYKFTVTKGERVGFDIDTPTNGPPGLGSYLRVFAADGRQLAANNDRLAPGDPPPGSGGGVDGFDSYIDYTFPAAGTYYVGVSNWQNIFYPVNGGTPVLGPSPDWLTGTYSLAIAPIARPEVRVLSAAWDGLTTSGPTPAAVIRLGVASTGFTGSAAVRLYQSADVTLQTAKDPLLNGDSVALVANSSQVRQVLLTAPPRGSGAANYVIAELSAAGAAPAVFALRVAEPAPLSFELQPTTPLANTRRDRVELWLRRYSADIVREAGLRNISPTAVAGAVAWEALENVRTRAFSLNDPQTWTAKGVGPGKVHVTESHANAIIGAGRGSGVARQVEDRYAASDDPLRLKQLTVSQRSVALADPQTAIKYIAAIMGAYAEEAATAGYDIRRRPDILATYYNGAGVDLATVAAALKKKYPAPLAPGPTMGKWVADNVEYLDRALSRAG